MLNFMYVLGVWDGHDSGAALIESDRIVFAANEERYTKRKLEVAFPRHSINAALKHEGISPSDIRAIALPTTEFTKTLSRVFPAQKEGYYRFRRRKMLRPRFEPLMHKTKYSMTSIGPMPMCGLISKAAVSTELRRMGFKDFKVYTTDHHTAHAAAAAFSSGFKRSLVVTLDGIGDGKSGSVSTLSKGELSLHESIPGRDSLGIFYEQVTNILGMRELEDEGKVMAMADFSYPFEFRQNKLKDFFKINGNTIKARYAPAAQYEMLGRIAWGTPKEQFAYMAQQVLEVNMEGLISNLHDSYGTDDLALSGGIMSNVKANMKVRENSGFRRIFVFPHMGDGGLALGAAMHVNHELNGISSYRFSAYLGPEYSENAVYKALKERPGIEFQREKDVARHAAELISRDNYVFWFQGRMEYGPRALGNRSILARADSDYVKDRLNLYVKQREWFQPFAPSMLDSEATRLLKDVGEKNKFMTMAYRVKEAQKARMGAVMHVDMTARPQMVGDENPRYESLIKGVKRERGCGVVLNTSFNIHGKPIVMTPDDALGTMLETNTRYMFIGDFFIENMSKKAR